MKAQRLFSQRDLVLALASGLLGYMVALRLQQRHYVISWHTPFITIFLNWMVVLIAVGDQVIKNWRSGRASEQLSWNVFLANISENAAWALLGWSVRDPVIIVARAPGLVLDQVVFWQMLASTHEAERRGKIFLWIKCALLPLLLTIAAAVMVPIWFLPQIQDERVSTALKLIVAALWLWSATGWVLQIKKNNHSGVLTGRDFSPKIPVLVEFYLASWLFHEYVNGRTGFTMYATMGVALTINTVLLIQCLYYYRQWMKQVKQGGAGIENL